MISKSYKTIVCALLIGTLAVSTNGQSTYETLRHHKNKAGRFGGPSMIQQIEYVQTAVDMV
jgi:murein endopeptidase